MSDTGIGGIFGEGSVATQFLLWGVAYGIASSVLAPVLTGIEQGAWKEAPLKVPEPADLADWVERGILDEGTAGSIAESSGVSNSNFANMVLNAGEPPGLDFVLQAFRRGFIPLDSGDPNAPSLNNAVAKSRLYTVWQSVVQQMANVPLPVADAVAAVLRGQVPLDYGLAEAFASGIDSDRFTVLFNTAGNPPSPTELVELYRRGFIPKDGTGPAETSFQQGIFEGDAKDKWWPLYFELTNYLPPPRTITALERAGVITPETAQSLYQQQGLSPELAAAYSKDASGQKLGATKQLAESQVLTLYHAQALDAAEATTLLQALGYSATEIAFLLEYQDLEREVSALNSAINRIGTLYTSHKITRSGAQGALTALAATPQHAAKLLSEWDVVRASNVRQLTSAQIADAWKIGALDEQEALTELQGLGYTPLDAWIVLSVKNGAALPEKPPPGPAGPGELP